MSGKYLRQSTASQTRTVGPFVDDTDFKTAEDALTINASDIRLKKNGAADVAKNSGGATADVNGQYAVTWDATDTDTVGELHYSIKVAGALQVFGSYTVLEEAVYDALFAASANAFTGAAGATKVTGVVLVDTVTNLTNLPTIPANWLTAAGTAADFSTELRTAINGGDYALSTDANGRIRIVDGTGVGEINTNGGAIALVDLVTDITTKTGYRLSATGVDDIWDEPNSGHLTADTMGGDLAAAKDNTDYPDGYVYLDETNGTAGTTVGLHGTRRTPSNSWADAAAIATSRGVKAVKVVPGYNGTATIGSGTVDSFHIDLNGGSIFLDDAVSTLSTVIFSSAAGARAYETSVNNPIIIGQACFLENLYINGLRVTHPQVYVKNCGFYGNITDGTGAPSASNRVYLAQCYNAKGTGDVTFALASGGHWLLEGWYGNLTLTGMAAGQTFTVFGYGKLTIAASCTGGTIQHTSHIEINDQAGGAVTTELISEPGSVSGFTTAAKAELQQEATDALNAYAPATPAQVNAEVLDVLSVDTLIDGKTFVQSVQYVSAMTAGRVSGAGTGTEVFKGLDEATTRVTVTVDGSGNRTDIVYG